MKCQEIKNNRTTFFYRNILLSFVLLLSSFAFHSCESCSKDLPSEDDYEDVCLSEYGICIDSLDVAEYKVKQGENLSIIFSRLGFSALQIDKIGKSCSVVLNPKRIVAGKNYYVYTTQDSIGAVKYVVFANSYTDFSVIDVSESDTIVSYLYSKPVKYKRKYNQGTIQSSLWNTIRENGGDPLLALKLSDIYAWQIDFFDIKEGDSYKVVYEASYIDDTIALSIGDIKGAIFTHKGREYHAIPFEQDGVLEFFDLDGNSLRKAFLKAPLDYFRITSRFTNSRYHPVLKRYRAHHGVDYAAPVGTPVKTIGDGTVIAKGYQKGGGGNFVKVKHNATYTTTYMHLHNFAKGIAVGNRVQQGQVIGYVGSTGLSTGPHLDFRVYKNGQPIDPLKMESPPSLPVKPELKDEFEKEKNSFLKEMEIFEIKDEVMKKYVDKLISI